MEGGKCIGQLKPKCK